jgi:DNA end-binding protein Ku
MPASASTRTVWKGAISFGLVHIPIALYGATAETRPKFKMIEKGSMSPVGHQQVNKSTGESVGQEEIVKGVEVEDGQYVVLTKEEIREALPKATQTIEIESFVDASEIPTLYYQKPYHVAPGQRGHKAYALLRDTLKKTGKVGIAKVVISTKQHLAALIPAGNGLVLNLLRWADEVREAPVSVLGEAASAVPTERELKMAEQLVNDMADAWSPDLFRDEFKEQLNELIQRKAAVGDLSALQPLPGQETGRPSADVIDLTELLKRSLQGKSAPPRSVKAAAAANDDAPSKRAAAVKASPKARASVKPAPRRSSGT